LAVRADDQGIVKMIEDARLRPRVRLGSGERGPDSNAAGVRDSFADARKSHGAVRVDIPEHINCAIRADGEAFHIAAQAVITGVIYSCAERSAPWLQDDPVNVAINL